MKAGYASRTAEHNALFRALESSLPAGQRLFEDRLAHAFLTWPLGLVARLARLPVFRSLVLTYIDSHWPGVRSSVVARTALIDEAIADKAREGAAQIVLLGAGYDSRPYRLPALRHLPAFEVDHPDTLIAKRRALQRVLLELPPNVRFVATDFNQDRLESAMATAGYNYAAPTIFVWEGVTNYLTEAAVDTTLRWCSRAALPSALISTYVHRDILTNPDAFVGADRLFATLAKVGEKLTFGMDPKALPQFLTDRGLSLERDIGAADYRRLYFKEGADSIRGHEFYRVAIAKIGEPSALPMDSTGSGLRRSEP